MCRALGPGDPRVCVGQYRDIQQSRMGCNIDGMVNTMRVNDSYCVSFTVQTRILCLVLDDVSLFGARLAYRMYCLMMISRLQPNRSPVWRNAQPQTTLNGGVQSRTYLVYHKVIHYRTNKPMHHDAAFRRIVGSRIGHVFCITSITLL